MCEAIDEAQVADLVPGVEWARAAHRVTRLVNAVAAGVDPSGVSALPLPGPAAPSWAPR
jgi:hypothetical protein